MTVLLDSGFLFAVLNTSEAEHQTTIQVLKEIRESIVLPVPAITEVAYLLARDIGQEAAADSIDSRHNRTDAGKPRSRRLHPLRRFTPAIL